MSPRALGGAPLVGDKLVRVVYMDESGSDPKDPLLVVAGIIVNADKSLVALEDDLDRLTRKHIPEEHRDGFVFHAVEIYGGGDRKCLFHNRDEWPQERRFAILDDLAALPGKFSFPICYGFIEKAKFPNPADRGSHSALEIAVSQHAMAIAQCAIGTELWMREFTTDEVTHMIAEDNHDVRVAARQMQVMLRDRTEIAKAGVEHPLFPLVRIRDGLQFATKAESKALQVADFCAWTIKRAAQGAKHTDRFYPKVRAQLITADF